jgi:hypothetical protein
MYKDYFYYEYQGRLILNEVASKAWGVLPQSDYCNTDSPFQALLADVVAYMYNTWGIKISNGSLLCIYLVGDLGGAYGVDTVKTPYGYVTARAVVIFHSNYNLRNLHLATLATYGALYTYLGSTCVGPSLYLNDGPLLMSRRSYWTWHAWPDGTYGTPLPYMTPAFTKPWLTGFKVNMSALVPGQIYTWELNSPTRFMNATYLSFASTQYLTYISYLFMCLSIAGITTATLRCLELCTVLRGFIMWIGGLRWIVGDTPIGTVLGHINGRFT